MFKRFWKNQLVSPKLFKRKDIESSLRVSLMKTKKHNYFKYSKRGSLNNSTRLWLVCGSVWSSYCMMSTSVRLKTDYLSKSSKQPLLIIDKSQPLTFSFGIVLEQSKICIQQRLHCGGVTGVSFWIIWKRSEFSITML